MTDTEYRLDTVVTGVIGASGGVSIAGIGPAQWSERWHIKLFSAKGPAIAKLEIFRSGSKIDGTEFADNATSDTDITLQAGESLTFTWSNGVVGTVMLCYISGERTVKGNRGYGV